MSNEPKKTLLDPAAVYRCYAIMEKDGEYTPVYLQIQATRVVKVVKLHEPANHPAIAYEYLEGDVGSGYIKKQLDDERKGLDLQIAKKRAALTEKST